jgi:hypothetical protein
MSQYALLILPSANRVSSGSAIGLTRAELGLLSGAVRDSRLADIGTSQIGGVPHVTFEAAMLGAGDLGFLARLSSAYALFERTGQYSPGGTTPLDSPALLRPVPLPS